MNLTQFLFDSNRDLTDKIAIDLDGEKLAYDELFTQIRAACNHLSVQGIEPKQRVAMVMDDKLDWSIIFFALSYLGAVPVLLSPKIPRTRLLEMLEECAPTFIFADSNVADGDNLSSIGPGTVLPMPEIKRHNNVKVRHLPYDYGNNEVGLWCISSGTSGNKQKFIQHLHSGIFKMAALNAKHHEIHRDSIIFFTPKLSYSYGLMCLVNGLCQGATVILSNKIASRKYLQKTIQHNQVTHFYTVPQMVSSLAQENHSNQSLDSVKFFICGGEPLPKPIEKSMYQIYNKKVLNSLGMSEILNWTTYQSPDKNKFGSIGLIYDEVEYEIRRQDGSLCGAFEKGELWIKHPCQSVGYHQNTMANDSTFYGKWFRTKDLVYQDHQSYLFYVCRCDDFIKINSSYVNLIEIEEELLHISQIEECLVTVYKDHRGFDQIQARIKFKQEPLSVAQIRRYLKNKIESHKIPRQIIVVEGIPKTISGKKIRNPDKLVNDTSLTKNLLDDTIASMTF